jgi:hypothetical protein
VGVTYPKALAIIQARAVAIYGTQTHLARLLGVTRQALAKRAKSTVRSRFLHEWWEGLLGLRHGALEAGEEPTTDLDPIRAAVALQAAIEAWPRVVAGAHYYPSPARLAANARRRGPRVKREAGCKKEGAQ